MTQMENASKKPQQSPASSRLARGLQAIRREGLGPVLRRNAARAWGRWRELRWGVDTRGSIDGEDLGSGAELFGYQPIDYGTFRLALRRIPLIPHQSVFLDYGCGKGRAVLLAARYPFKKVVGVEISAELCQQARQNLAQARRHLRCPDVEIIHADATQYSPPDDLSVVFLYNPFDAAVVERVLERLHASLVARPRTLRIVYALPNCRRDVLSECEWLESELLATDNSQWERLCIYTSRLERLAAPTAATVKDAVSPASDALARDFVSAEDRPLTLPSPPRGRGGSGSYFLDDPEEAGA